MSKNNNTLKQKEKQYHHLTKNNRIKIESLINQKDKSGKRLFNNTYIANYLGVHKSTISRELRKRRKKKCILEQVKLKLCLIQHNMCKKMLNLKDDYLKVNIN